MHECRRASVHTPNNGLQGSMQRRAPTPLPPLRRPAPPQAKCDAPIRVELIDRATGQPVTDDLPDVVLEVGRDARLCGVWGWLQRAGGET